MIGKMLIERLHTVNVQLLVFDPFLSPAQAQALGVRKAQTLEEVFASCQLVSNHLANNADTKAMLRYEHFSLLPPNAVFLNTAAMPRLTSQASCAFSPSGRECLRGFGRNGSSRTPAVGPSPLFPAQRHPHPSYRGQPRPRGPSHGRIHAGRIPGLFQGLPTRYSVSLEMLKTMA